jgi:excisionase family DNA binding protein
VGITVKEAARKTGLSEQHVRYLINKGTFRASRIGARLLLVEEDSLAAFRRTGRHSGKNRPENTTAPPRVSP